MWISRRSGWLFAAISCLIIASIADGCVQRLNLPPTGPPIPYAARLELAPSIAAATAQYTDSCGHIQEIPVGSVLEEALTEAAHRTFQSVSAGTAGAKASSSASEVAVRVDLVYQKLGLKQDSLYDRVPADLQLSGLARFYDPSGKLLRESDIKVNRNERLRIEPVQKNCNYVIDPFVQDSAVEFASKFIEEARSAYGTGRPTNGPKKPIGNVGAAAVPLAQDSAQPATGQSLAAARPVASPLRFKATMLDENSNLVFEGGERIRVRVDIVNSGEQDLQGITASLTGTAYVLSQFPTTTLSIGRLTAGQSRSVEFVATLPPSVQSQQAELRVTLIDSFTDTTLPPQNLTLTIRPTGMKVDDVDQIPAGSNGYQRPNTYVISVGIGSYRDQQIPPRKFASLDAEMVAAYFQSLGGVPAANVRLLQDWKALRPDIDEALLDWLPPHMGKDAVVIVYFAGQAMVSSMGEMFLVPYEGSVSATSRLYPLKDFETALSRLKAKQTLFLFDGSVSRLGSDNRAKTVTPQWNPTGGTTVHVIGNGGLGRGLEDDTHRHGLFTYYLLRGLRGDADTNRDTDVTLGEIAAFVSQKVSWAARTQFGQEQRTLILPPLRSGDRAAELTLAKPASIQAVAQ